MSKILIVTPLVILFFAMVYPNLPPTKEDKIDFWTSIAVVTFYVWLALNILEEILK